MIVFDWFVAHRACLVLKRLHCFQDYICLSGKFTFVLGWMTEEKNERLYWVGRQKVQ